MNNMHPLNIGCNRKLPAIDCVLIGVNSAKTLGRCINSILESNYPGELLRICYVDGGSTDESIPIARSYPGLSLVALNPEHPAPGLQRNAGWKNGNAPLVQFLDSDTILDPDWLQKAVQAIGEPTVGAVNGYRRELHPEKTFYNWLGDIEWNGPPGPSDCFGGDVLIRREALEQSGGYDETLVGGEDPELSRRIKRNGWQIIRLDALMTRHDLAMTTIRQYLKRAFRSGYGFAAVRVREARAGSDFWKIEHRKIFIRGGGFIAGTTVALILAALMKNPAGAILSLFSLAGGTALLLNPRIRKVGQFMREQQLNRPEAKKYAWHCSLVVLPQLFGVLRFHVGQLLGKPLRNRRNALKTGLSTSRT
ncbi:glycosyltransferase [Chlorobium limicola]